MLSDKRQDEDWRDFSQCSKTRPPVRTLGVTEIHGDRKLAVCYLRSLEAWLSTAKLDFESEVLGTPSSNGIHAQRLPAIEVADRLTHNSI